MATTKMMVGGKIVRMTANEAVRRKQRAHLLKRVEAEMAKFEAGEIDHVPSPALRLDLDAFAGLPPVDASTAQIAKSIAQATAGHLGMGPAIRRGQVWRWGEGQRPWDVNNVEEKQDLVHLYNCSIGESLMLIGRDLRTLGTLVRDPTVQKGQVWRIHPYPTARIDAISDGGLVLLHPTDGTPEYSIPLAQVLTDGALYVQTPEPDRRKTPRAKHQHYFRDVSHLDEIDVYRVLDLFNVTDQSLGHAIKKLLVAGGRGAGKDFLKDVQEAIDTLARRVEMEAENASRNVGS